jgi:hypothetical protein
MKTDYERSLKLQTRTTERDKPTGRPPTHDGKMHLKWKGNRSEGVQILKATEEG